jgi:membrane protein implicated in regulation of membrane protease activity
VAHSAQSSPSRARTTTGAGEPSVGNLVQSAMADVSTLIRSEIELAKAEVGKSAKKAGIGAGALGAAGVLLAFSGIFLFVTIAEFLTWLGLERWISYLIVWVLLLLLAGIAALIGRRSLKKIEKPERTLETLRDLPEVIHREAPGQRRREVPTVTDGRVQLRGNENYTV